MASKLCDPAQLACYTGEVTSEVARAGRWFLGSGIQEKSGGVARYYRADLRRNLPVSTEITGYALSALVYLHSVANDDRGLYLNRATAAANFLAHTAWDAQSRVMPFEIGPAERAYFFDSGIVVRGLLSAWRATGCEKFLEIAVAVGRSMAEDFASGDGYHPILSLPGKQPVARDPLSWSKSAGCYQLKAAMAWWDLGEAVADTSFRDLYDRVLDDALRTWESFLPGHPDRIKVVDRLHPFLYFLEGLLPRAAEPRCQAALRAGIPIAARHLRNLAPAFERADVYAQLLRIRVYADCAGAAPLDRTEAAFEAKRLASFQSSDSDPRMDGGFAFGRLHGSCIPHVSPVPTAFALQALTLWDAYSAGPVQPHLHLLI